MARRREARAVAARLGECRSTGQQGIGGARLREACAQVARTQDELADVPLEHPAPARVKHLHIRTQAAEGVYGVQDERVRVKAHDGDRSPLPRFAPTRTSRRMQHPTE
jgi:hypothetical protein